MVARTCLIVTFYILYVSCCCYTDWGWMMRNGKQWWTQYIRNSDWKYSCVHCIGLFHADFISEHHNAGPIPWHIITLLSFLTTKRLAFSDQCGLGVYAFCRCVSPLQLLDEVSYLYDNVCQYYAIRGHFHRDLVFASADDRVSEFFFKPSVVI